MNYLFIILSSLTFLACSSQPIIPNGDDITVSRKQPPKDCKLLSKVTGTTLDPKATRKQVLEDMKQQAANKGATYIVINQFSDLGTYVTGEAYKCP